MQPWLIFSSLSVFLSTAYGLFSKIILNKSEDDHPIAYASVLFFTVALYSVIAYFFQGINYKDLESITKTEVLPILIVNILLYTLAPSFYWRALKNLPASEVAILFNISSLYILIFGLILGTETFSLQRVTGGIFIFTATSLAGLYTQHKSKFKINKYFFMMMIATLLYAFGAITDNFIITKKYFSPLFFQILNFGIPSVLILLINKNSMQYVSKIYQPKIYKYMMLNSLFFFGSFWLIYKAYEAGGVASEVGFTLSTETILVVILAAIFLKERDHLKIKMFAAGLVCFGLYLLA